MRLTLRTLLAYLDDVLSPADTKIIGQKIQESPMAQLLVSRIKEVMRRRRLKAPELFGASIGIDPNIVAQYLDNTLAPETYADVERVLLESDELLAETASCHQVLTLILGEQTEVSLASRERLYALGPVDSTSQLAVPSDTSLSVQSRTPESISTRNAPPSGIQMGMKSVKVEDERITTVPDYLKPAPWSARFLPSAIIAALILVCAALFVPGLSNIFQQATREIQRKAPRDQVISPADDSEESTPSTENDAATATVAAATKTTEAPRSSIPAVAQNELPQGLDPAPPMDDFDADLPSPEVNAPTEPKDAAAPAAPIPGDPVAKPVPNVASAAGPRPGAKVPEIPAEILSELQVTYSSPEGVVVRYDESQQHWFAAPRRQEIKPGETIANLEPFDGVLEFEKAGVRALVVSEAVVKLMPPSDSILQGLEIGHGRFVLQTVRKDDEARGAIGITIGEDTWKLELLNRDTVCAIEVTPREPVQFQKYNDYHWYMATLYVMSGTARWTHRDGPPIEIPQSKALTIVPERDVSSRMEPIAIASPPDWTDASKRRTAPLRRYLVPFEKAFEPDLAVEQSLLMLVKTTKNPKIAELATRGLSAVHNYRALVETLAECPHEDARFAARDGLRQWLPMEIDRGRLLKAELETYYSPVDAEAVYRLLWGFTPEDVKDSPVTSSLFPNWMLSQKLEIRELADFWVERLTRRKSEYRANADEKQRLAYVRRLEAMIERDKGLIK
ncbi:hypothetical protein [Schlesneria paludicola]|uniref:hypothetical protein n=1 Tax=Schlesneria paludicola TaxID=360056 RepID=UPI00029B497A|nr:hypothetical protein [Schlesneria paludicola]